MANERSRTDDQFSGPTSDRQSNSGEERVRNSYGEEEVRGVAAEGEEEFEDMEDVEEDEDDGSF
jgi:hypothetical protein